MEDARSAADHGLALGADVPGEAQARIEVVLIPLWRSQVTVKERADYWRAIQVVIEQLVLVNIGDAVAKREGWFNTPVVSEEEAQTIIARRIVAIERLRLARVADAGDERAQREPQDVSRRRQQSGIERDEGPVAIGRGHLQARRQRVIDRYIGSGPRPPGREGARVDGDRVVKGDRRRLVEGPTSDAVKMLPLSAEAQPVRAFAPAQRIGQLISAQDTVLRRLIIGADAEIAASADLRPAQPQTDNLIATILSRWNIEASAIEAVRVAEVVDHARRENRAETAEHLGGDVFGHDPVRGHAHPAARIVIVIVIRTQPDEGVMLVGHLPVELCVGLLGAERVRRNVVVLREDRVVVIDGKDAVLIVVLEIEKPEEFVFLDRSPETAARLSPREKRVVQRGVLKPARVASEARKSGDVVIAVVHEG